MTVYSVFKDQAADFLWLYLNCTCSSCKFLLPRRYSFEVIHDLKICNQALHISVSYLLDESETDSQSHIDQDMFILEAKENFGSKGAKEAQEVLGRVNSLFAGGELDEDAKDVFFQAIMSVYMDSKKTAREKYTPKKYRKHKDKE